MTLQLIFGLLPLVALARAACLSSGDQTTINDAFQAGGEGAIVQLCPSSTFSTTDKILFTAANQELSTEGYPTDDTRATIQIATGTNFSGAIDGRWFNNVRVLNLKVDGNRRNAGLAAGDALIEMGGGASGQVVRQNVLTDTRSWSCMHFIGSGQDDNPCRQGEVSYNTIGPCGEDGKDPATGQARWADGLSIDCTETTVSHNDITGPTDGGIVIFGSPGSQIVHNTITSSDEYLGFGAINMVDPEYGGNYSHVNVSYNTIVGQGNGLFELGIAIGSHVWSSDNSYDYFGPATVTNNQFSGNVGFPIAINGWYDGLTATDNDVSGVHSPNTDFSDASLCSTQVQDSFDAGDKLIVYRPSVAGPLTLQSDFVSIPTNGTHWLCLSKPLPTSLSFGPGEISVTGAAGKGVIADLSHFRVQLQGDGNTVGYDTTGGVNTPRWSTGHLRNGCGDDGSQCKVEFGSDGNFSETDSQGLLWTSATGGRGSSFVLYNDEPWVEIKDAQGTTIWVIADLDA